MTADDVNEHREPTAIASYATTGEAEVAQAMLWGFGIDAVIDDQIQGGVIPIEGEDGVILAVRSEDAADARKILVVDPAARPEVD
jgi:hypothetical protein